MPRKTDLYREITDLKSQVEEAEEENENLHNRLREEFQHNVANENTMSCCTTELRVPASHDANVAVATVILMLEEHALNLAIETGADIDEYQNTVIQIHEMRQWLLAQGSDPSRIGTEAAQLWELLAA